MNITKTPQELRDDIRGITHFLLATCGHMIDVVGIEALMDTAFALEVISIEKPEKGIKELFEEVGKAQIGTQSIFGLTNEDLEKGSNEIRLLLSEACLDGTLGQGMQEAFLSGLGHRKELAKALEEEIKSAQKPYVSNFALAPKGVN